MITGLLIEKKYDIYIVFAKDREFRCKLVGKAKLECKEAVAGDIVDFDETTLLIRKIHDRKNFLIRPKSANISKTIIIMSLVSPDFDFYLLTKYLMQIEFNNINDIIICISKSDLIDINDEKYKKIFSDLRSDSYIVYDINDPEDFLKIKQIFDKEIVVLLVGQTGVGKSTLINNVLGTNLQKTQEISKALNRGKHTTTSSKLISINKAFVIDTPGFSSFDARLDSNQMAKSFNDFFASSSQCGFNDCLHIHEPKCKIKEQVNNGIISNWKYENYKIIIAEREKNEKRK